MFLRISRPQKKWVTFLTLYLYYIKPNQECQVFFHLFFIFFVDSIHPPLPVWHPVRTYSYRPSIKDHKESHGELQTASSVVLLHLHLFQKLVTSLVELFPVLLVIVFSIKPIIGLY